MYHVNGTFNGIGDRILDIIGSMLLAECTKKQTNHVWHSNNVVMQREDKIIKRNYHIDDFKFHFGTLGQVNSDKRFPKGSNIVPIHYTDSGLSFSPLYLCASLNKPLSQYMHMCACFSRLAQTSIKPSEDIKAILPTNLDNTIGIHLRRSDKINKRPILTHEMNISEYEELINSLLVQATKTEYQQSFLIISDDPPFINLFKSRLQNLKPDAQFVNMPENASDVVDFFALTMCKCIYQGIKYSTFSILAAMIGNIQLYNFAKNHEPYSLLHYWKHCVQLTCQGMDMKYIPSIDQSKTIVIPKLYAKLL